MSSPGVSLLIASRTSAEVRLRWRCSRSLLLCLQVVPKLLRRLVTEDGNQLAESRFLALLVGEERVVARLQRRDGADFAGTHDDAPALVRRPIELPKRDNACGRQTPTGEHFSWDAS